MNTIHLIIENEKGERIRGLAHEEFSGKVLAREGVTLSTLRAIIHKKYKHPERGRKETDSQDLRFGNAKLFVASLDMERSVLAKKNEYNRKMALEDDGKLKLSDYGGGDGTVLIMVEEEVDMSRAEEDLERASTRMHSLQSELFARMGQLVRLKEDHSTIVNTRDQELAGQQAHGYARSVVDSTEAAGMAAQPRFAKNVMRQFVESADRRENTPKEELNEMGSSERPMTVIIYAGDYQEISIKVPARTTFGKLLHEVTTHFGVPGEAHSGFSLVTLSGGICPSDGNVVKILRNVGDNSGVGKLYFVNQELPSYSELVGCTEKLVALKLRKDVADGTYTRDKKAEDHGNYHESGEGHMAADTAKHELLIADLPKFLAFFILFTVVTVNRYNTSKSFWLTSAVRNAVVEQPYGEFNEKTFKGITELSGVWEWIEGPFIDTMLTRSTAASAKPPYITAETNKSGYVLGLNKIVGTIQMQQLRVTDGSTAGEGCTLSGAEDITQFIPDGCYDVYGSNAASATALFTGKSSQSTTPFGTCVENRSEFQFRPAPADGSGEWFFAKFGNYDPAGYFASINALNRTSATDTINNLKKCGWFDKQTRALFVNFNMYNANYNMWIATSILFEHNAAGLVFPTSRFLTLEMDMYTTQEGVMYGALDIVLVLLSWSWVGGYVKEAQYVKRVRGSFKPYFESGWVWVDIILVLAFNGCVAFKILFLIDPRRIAADVTNPAHSPYGDLAFWYRVGIIFDGLVVFICCFKSLKYFNLTVTSHALVSALANAFGSLVAYIIVFGFVLSGFVLIFHNVYGASVYQFRNLTSTAKALLVTLLGNVDYEDIFIEYPTFSQWLFIVYIVVMYFVLLNMFLAILNESYLTTKIYMAKNPGEVSTVSYSVFKRVFVDSCSSAGKTKAEQREEQEKLEERIALDIMNREIKKALAENMD